MKENKNWMLVGILSLTLYACNQNQPKYLNTSLNPKYNFGCISIDQVKNEYPPTDLYPAYVQCIKEKRYLDAVALFNIAEIYGFYDFYRVKDKKSYQSIDMLKVNINRELTFVTEEEKNEIRQIGIKYENPIYPEHTKFCNDIKRIGPPSYYPGYMIQNGMDFLMHNDRNPIIENFNSQNKWKELLLGKRFNCPI